MTTLSSSWVPSPCCSKRITLSLWTIGVFLVIFGWRTSTFLSHEIATVQLERPFQSPSTSSMAFLVLPINKHILSLLITAPRLSLPPANPGPLSWSVCSSHSSFRSNSSTCLQKHTSADHRLSLLLSLPLQNPFYSFSTHSQTVIIHILVGLSDSPTSTGRFRLCGVCTKNIASHFSKQRMLQPSSHQLPPMVHPEGNSGWRKTGYWPYIVKMPIKGMILISPDSCIFSYIEKH